MAKLKEIEQFIGTLKIDEGELIGEPFKVLPWQRKLLRNMLKTDTDLALSMARGNGKSTFLAALGLCATIGPLAYPNSEVIIVAASHSQGQIVFNHAMSFAEPWIENDKSRYKMRNSQNRVDFTDKATKCRLRVIGAKPKTASGLAPLWVICDELASWETNQIDKMLAILSTSMGKIPNSRAIYIGTRADSPDHPFERILNDPQITSFTYSAPKTDKPHLKSTWLKANPSLRHMPHLEKRIRIECERAKKNPSVMASFKSLRLNQGVSDTLEAVLLTAETWEACEVDTIAPRGPYSLGVDLGGSAAMSAVSAYWMETEELDAFALFPHYPNLQTRAENDGVGGLYERAAERKELLRGGDRVACIRTLLIESKKRWGYPAYISCDRWRADELRQVLDELNFPVVPFIERGQGFRDGAEDVRLFRAACLDGHVKAKRSLLFRVSIAGARVQTDPAGNSKLSKLREGGRRQNHRDDLIAAAILAVAQGRRVENRPVEQEFAYAVI